MSEPSHTIANLQALLASRDCKVEDLEYRNNVLVEKLEDAEITYRAHIRKLEAEIAQLRQCQLSAGPLKRNREEVEEETTDEILPPHPAPRPPPPPPPPSTGPQKLFFIKINGIATNTLECEFRSVLAKFGQVRYFRYFPSTGNANAIFETEAETKHCVESLNDGGYQATAVEIQESLPLVSKINAFAPSTPDTVIKELYDRFGPTRYFRRFLCNAEAIFLNSMDALQCVDTLHNTNVCGNTISTLVTPQGSAPARQKTTSTILPAATRPIVQLPQDSTGQAAALALRDAIMNNSLVQFHVFPFGKQDTFIRTFLSKYGEVGFVVLCQQHTLVGYRSHSEALQCVLALHNTARGPITLSVSLATEVQIG
jgi:hypothetical protein